MNFFDRAETFAALDLGTTNCRLLVARSVSDGMRVIDSFSRIVRLGEGLEASGMLSEEAMDRTIEALVICASKLRHRHVGHIRAVATEACRRATNCADFLARVRRATGFELEIIPTGEEARLALAGCAPLLDPEIPHALVFDIGGGSTELLWVAVRPNGLGGAATEIRAVISLPFGVVSLTERYQHRPSTLPLYQEMIEEIRRNFRDFDENWGISRQIGEGGVQMLGSSGTVTTLAGIHLGLPRYDRSRVDGIWCRIADLTQISLSLVRMGRNGRAQQPCIGPARADLMVAGCAILQAICTTWPVGHLRVADRGVREGILADLAEEALMAQEEDESCASGQTIAPLLT